jgi:hypothetical protein
VWSGCKSVLFHFVSCSECKLLYCYFRFMIVYFTVELNILHSAYFIIWIPICVSCMLIHSQGGFVFRSSAAQKANREYIVRAPVFHLERVRILGRRPWGLITVAYFLNNYSVCCNPNPITEFTRTDKVMQFLHTNHTNSVHLASCWCSVFVCMQLFVLHDRTFRTVFVLRGVLPVWGWKTKN